jgi:hypothetical protein
MAETGSYRDNHGKTLWRLRIYDEQEWGIWRWRFEIAEAPHGPPNIADESELEHFRGFCKTRNEAIGHALEAGDREASDVGRRGRCSPPSNRKTIDPAAKEIVFSSRGEFVRHHGQASASMSRSRLGTPLAACRETDSTETEQGE